MNLSSQTLFECVQSACLGICFVVCLEHRGWAFTIDQAKTHDEHKLIVLHSLSLALSRVFGDTMRYFLSPECRHVSAPENTSNCCGAQFVTRARVSLRRRVFSGILRRRPNYLLNVRDNRIAQCARRATHSGSHRAIRENLHNICNVRGDERRAATAAASRVLGNTRSNAFIYTY